MKGVFFPFTVWKRLWACRYSLALPVMLVGLLALPARAIDPPHNTTASCADCHIGHHADGGMLTRFAVNANLCMSCHVAGGTASAKAFVAADQALPWPGLPNGTNATGNSHRWDSGVAGHLVFLGGAVTPSTGTLASSGVYTGYYAKTYSLQITSSGAVGTAQFTWSATSPGGGAGTNFTGTNVPLDSGVFLTFANGTNTSFQTGDRWNLFVRPDLRNPTNATLSASLFTGSLVACSTCHDEHSQLFQPFDTNAPAYAGMGTGSGRHFMRIANNLHQLCNDCHAPRAVTNAVSGSHPVEIFFAADAYHKRPTQLPVEAGTTNLGCLTCHQIHHGADADGKLLRLANSVSVCTDCHTLADTATPAAHFVSTNNATLWPGGKYGSLMPARTDTADRGTCLNCHAIHGWPDAANPTNHYPHLLADYQEKFCYTCHGSINPAPGVKVVETAFTNVYHHPVADNDPYRRAGRSVECVDCHNPHKAGVGSHVYTATATAFRNTVTNAPSLKGVDGVAFNYTGLTNFQVIPTNRFSYISNTVGATNEYQICFKCHTSYSNPGYTAGTASFTAASATVTGAGTAWTTNLIGSWIGRTNDTRTYTVTAVASATSLTIFPAYAGTSGAGNYTTWNIPAGLTPYYIDGTANFTSGSTNVTGSGTSWNSGMVGSWIYGSNNPAAVYKIISVTSATALTIYPAFQ